MHVAQHSSEIPFYVFNFFQATATEYKLHKGVLNEVLGGVSLVLRESHGPREQTFIPLGEQSFTFLIWLCGHSALIQHFFSGLSGLVPLGANWNRTRIDRTWHDP